MREARLRRELLLRLRQLTRWLTRGEQRLCTQFLSIDRLRKTLLNVRVHKENKCSSS